MRACMAGAAPAECAAREWGRAQQLIKGMYALPMAAWLAAYPRAALLVLTLEELRRGRPATHRAPRPARHARRRGALLVLAGAGGGQARTPRLIMIHHMRAAVTSRYSSDHASQELHFFKQCRFHTALCPSRAAISLENA